MRLMEYIFYKLVRRKHNSRPLEMKYLWIAKATGLTYSQVWRQIDKLVEYGILEKFQSYTTERKTRNFYRLKN